MFIVGAQFWVRFRVIVQVWLQVRFQFSLRVRSSAIVHVVFSALVRVRVGFRVMVSFRDSVPFRFMIRFSVRVRVRVRLRF